MVSCLVLSMEGIHMEKEGEKEVISFLFISCSDIGVVGDCLWLSCWTSAGSVSIWDPDFLLQQFIKSAPEASRSSQNTVCSSKLRWAGNFLQLLISSYPHLSFLVSSIFQHFCYHFTTLESLKYFRWLLFSKQNLAWQTSVKILQTFRL